MRQAGGNLHRRPPIKDFGGDKRSEVPIKKILIINIFGIGDVLFTTPLLSNIKARDPKIFIGYIANKRAAQVLTNNPHIDKLFIYEKDDYRELLKRSKIEFLRSIASTLSKIKAEGFDACIDLSLNKYSSLLMRLIGIKKRVGFNYKNRSPFLTDKIPLAGYEGKHVAEYYLSLLEHLNIPVVKRELELPITDQEKLWAQDIFKKQGLKPSDKVVALVPGGGASWGKDAHLKRWPAEKYAKLADKIIEFYNAKVILLGDVLEQALCQEVLRSMRGSACILPTAETIGSYAALLKNCRLAVLNDGGPLHIAVAAGVRTLSIFGAVDEEVYGPFPRSKHIVVTNPVACRPCYRRFKMARCQHHNCLKYLEVEQVLERLGEAL